MTKFPMTTLLDLFRQFKQRGQKTVFVYRTGIRRFTYSYGWLHENSLRFSAWLESQGISPGDRVAIWAPNSPWWAVVFWGCVVRGVIVVPVDFMSGRERAEKIIQLTETKLILQSQYKLDKITENTRTRKLIVIEELEYILPSFSPETHQFQPQPDDIAELIYTSGTTGDSKGVILTHRNLTANLMQISQHVPVVDDKWNFLSVLPLSHTFEQMAGFLTPLYCGGNIVYLRTLKPSAIMSALASEDIYAFPIVPRLLMALKTAIERELEHKHLGKLFHQLLHWQLGKHTNVITKRAKWFWPIHRTFGKHFQFFISGGAALPRETAEFWMGMGFRVIEGYGITECSPVLTANTFDEQIIGSTGKPLPGVEIKIENNEILAKGPNVFPGYYQNDEATKRAFTADGWFKTGDNGLIDERGNLYIKGRQKEMIVTGAGINVYPDDIEPVLHQLPGVKDACVIGRQTAEGEEVHAVLILADQLIADQRGLDADARGQIQRRPAVLAKSIIDQANAKLDNLQQITGFTIWPENEFPKTATMKIQKFKVKEQIQELGIRHQELGTQTDRLVDIISRVTGKQSGEISETSILVSDLGLTSIARLELVNTIEQEFRLDLEDTAITQTTTVAELRRMIEKREKHPTKRYLRLWPHTSWGRKLRYVADHLINEVPFHIFVKLRVEGLDKLQGIKGPVIFIANHVSYLDGPCIHVSLPRAWRYRLAPAVWQELFFDVDQSWWQRLRGRICYEYLAFFGCFTISQKGAFRASLEAMGQLIDRGVNILFFPEGERSRDAKLGKFQKGLGLLVRELRVPVAPVKIIGVEKLLPRGSAKLKRGVVTIRYGRPLVFGDQSPTEIINSAYHAIENL